MALTIGGEDGVKPGDDSLLLFWGKLIRVRRPNFIAARSNRRRASPD
jgi:hypothetical protein